ncbi:hypothetical protein [Photorhabdus bodei]|uniref:Uncharacterized protein n=1 Tax=Photorhabdus bodei TaxID=2029681 RepID=A0ABX0APS1_9GAMM|nr:hypothetical protein [Photorhabdus bodei]NDK98599.1 hypothetical protein [Photorhabdus bodei]NDL02852.1 hypothetical protein [Photorhabdus bodei]NDL07057.1 hypothetical protein [Photorhabdus bodei]
MKNYTPKHYVVKKIEDMSMTTQIDSDSLSQAIPVIFQVASLLAALAHPGHIVIYAPGDSLPCRRDAS